jgi:hypothetical protein
MASDSEKAEFDKQATTSSRVAFPPFPKIPEVFKQRPEYRAAWDEFEKRVDEWIKKVNLSNPPST